MKRAELKENIIVILLIFTFGIPVIPVAAIMGYQHFFPSSENSAEASAPSANFGSSSEDSDGDDPLRGGSGSFSSADSSSNWDCTSDCSGHEAGYEWAEEHEICDTGYDNGNSESFNEGVRAWAEDNCSSDDEYSDDYDYYR